MHAACYQTDRLRKRRTDRTSRTPGVVLSANELAEHSGLEPPTVSKILKPLSQAGLVEGRRGAYGGYRLARTPGEITLIQIVEAIEGPLAITECSQDHNQCSITHQCGIRSNWQLINTLIAQALRSITLAQMLAPLPAFSTHSQPRTIAASITTT